MELIVEPDTALVDQKVSIRMTGLEPGEQVTLRAAMTEMPGAVYEAESFATFIAGVNGEVHLDQQAPVAGTYSGVDPMGLFWSMKVSHVRYSMTRKLDQLTFVPAASGIMLSAESAKGRVAKANLQREYVSSKVLVQDVKEHGLVGKYFYLPDQPPAQGVLVLGGGEGGLASSMNYAALFASYGFPSLALAYFRFEHLQEHLQEIPLEYFYQAIEWLRHRQEVRPDRNAVFGRSKGAELSLILGTVFPEIGCVIASSPSSTACIGHIEPGADHSYRRYSSWSYQGKALPYVEWTNEQCEEALNCFKTYKRIDHIHKAAFEQCDRLEEVTIPVEKIAGPILIITSTDDHWWPAELHGERIAARLKAKGFSHKFEHLHYEDTGHLVRYPYIPTTQLSMNGGTPFNNYIASLESWNRIKQFLMEISDE
ncbi:acyl-CoA thioesterase/bile acid-CoA:amino acid N-acyltransferase family protein [Paenibacillus sp. SAFN-117]|uniref:acyl-CoA thioesterase/bile acid-CoA:amino acid N-acyltransferase family protein n=1 Tax=Paenibacillus sp. SAFN-117 TaxID=3436860 RepID=UPI003F81CA0A